MVAPEAPKPRVIAVIGWATSGKTTLANALAPHLNLPVVDIDDGPARCTLPHPQPVETDEEQQRLRKIMRVCYATLIAAAAANVREGISVIVIATFSRQSAQRELEQAVREAGGELKIIRTIYDDSPEEVERRVNERVDLGRVGGCRTVSHFKRHREGYEEIILPHLEVTMSGGANGTQNAVKAALEYLG